MTGRTDPPAEHYFTARPQAPSRPREITVQARGLTLHLQTDCGVFSASRLDRGTRLLAEKMQLRPGTALLDWGAGYGALGLIAARLCPTCRVTLVELNERAARLAEANARSLQLDHVEVIVGPAPEVLGARTFDAIISNPPLRVGKPAVLAVIEYAARQLRPGGELWLVIPTSKGAKTYLQQMAKLFARTETKAISGGYRVLWAARDDAATD